MQSVAVALCARASQRFSPLRPMALRSAGQRCFAAPNTTPGPSSDAREAMEQERPANPRPDDDDVAAADQAQARKARAAAAGAADFAMPSLLVFGGSGYVGTHVCQEALRIGLSVTSVSRGGRPPNEAREWADDVDWVAADALRPETYAHLLPNCLAVVSTVGLISTSQEEMLKMNGEVNTRLINAAADAGVARFALISAHDYKFPGDLVLLRGYFQGKRDAEAALAARFPQQGVALRPGFIHGTRRWGSASIPLSAIGSPLEAALNLVPSKALARMPVAGAAFVPPVSVQAVAKAAVAAASDPAVSGGVMDVWTIASHA